MEQKQNSLVRSIALLRAINIQGHYVKMEVLRASFEALGFANVATFITSGNVIFESPAEDVAELERRIEKQLHAALGFAVATFIRSPAELAAVGNFTPFAAEDMVAADSYLNVVFLPAPIGEAAQQKILALRTPQEEFSFHGREFYWLSRRNLGAAKFSGARLERFAAMPATVRNVTTIRKLATLYHQPSTVQTL